MTQATAASKIDLNRKWKPWIDGSFRDGSGERNLINPADGEVLATVQEANQSLAEEAILSARRAFDDGPWKNFTAFDRAKILFKIADLIEKKADYLAELETLNSGKPIREAVFDIEDSAQCFRYYAGLATKPMGQTVEVPAPSVTSIVREPIGVCGQIIPWNYPLLMAAWKLAPALCAGNTCVLKPSEYTPLTALALAEILQEVDLPQGVVNILVGDGPSVGHTIAESHLVDKLAFTGSVKTGKAVAQAALSNLKKVSLELGGKSPFVVFSDFDLDTAVDYALFAIYCNAGQVCSAGSRMIVEDSVYHDFLHRLCERAKKIKIGPGIDKETEMGPLISEKQLTRVMDYIEIGQSEGARIETGGQCLQGKSFGKGFYVSPTVFSETRPDMRIVQEEIFGPVCVLQRFSEESEAIKLSNDTHFGLAGAVFTNDITRANRFAKALRAGVTWVNGYHSTYNECPWGGYKQSGWGRELGTFGLEAYTEVKQININMDPAPVKWFSNN